MAGLAAVPFLAACSGSDPNAPSGGGASELVFATRQGDNNMAKALVDLWNGSHDQKVRLEQLSGNTADAQRQQLSLELSAKSPTFDVIGLDVVYTGEFAKNEWLDPLDDIAGPITGSMWPGPVASGVYKGKQYAMPLLLGAGLLYYRTDVAATPPATWDDLTTAGLAAKSKGLNGFAAQGAAYEGMVCNYLEHLWAHGGDLFDADKTKVVFGDNDAASKAIEFMKTSFTNGLDAPGFNTMTEPEARASFETGKTAFMRHWAGPYVAMQNAEGSAIKGKFAIAPLPSFGGAPSASALGGLNLTLNAYGKHKDEAKKFITWAASDPAAQALLATKGLGPVLKSTYSDAKFADQPLFKTLAQVLPEAKARPAVAQWGDISTVMSQQIFSAYNGQSSADAAITAIKAALDKAVK